MNDWSPNDGLQALELRLSNQIKELDVRLTNQN